jgi:hypothetical protein
MAYSLERDKKTKTPDPRQNQGPRLMGSEGYRAPGFCVTLAMIISTISSKLR